MQQMTLLCGADPQLCKIGPAVKLQSGRWRFECESVKTSVLYLVLISVEDETVSVQHGAEFELEKNCIVQLRFRERGKESFINVNVTKLS